MQFDASFYKPETRAGFDIKGMMKRYWASSMEVLEELDRVCRKNNIRYFAFYGTLLGAVRHKGWIPWDDDLDIIMYRDEFNKFVAACKNDLDPMFALYNVDQSCIFPPRIINAHFSSIDKKFLERFHGCPYPTGIDIYIMDKVPTEEEDRRVVKEIHQIVRYMSQQTDRWYGEAYGGTSDLTQEDIDEVVAGLEEFLGTTLPHDASLPGQLTKIAYAISAMYNDTDSPYLARINNWAVMGDAHRWPKEWFEEVIYLPFEQMMIPCPKMYHEVLTATMGANYMEPIKFLNSHSYPSYRTQEEQVMALFEAFKAPIPDYFLE